MSSIVLLLALAFNQYDLAFMTALMGFVVASA
jgi:membrane glycosyltransferase